MRADPRARLDYTVACPQDGRGTERTQLCEERTRGRAGGGRACGAIELLPDCANLIASPFSLAATTRLLDTVLVYDIVENSFRRSDPFPIGINMPNTKIHNGHLYVHSGETGVGCVQGSKFNVPTLSKVGDLFFAMHNDLTFRAKIAGRTEEDFVPS